MAKIKKDPIKKVTLETVVIKGKKPAPKPVRVDSMAVGGQKRAIKDVAKAVSTLNKSNTAKSYVAGIDASNPYKSTKTLAARGSASDLVNKVIDNGKKKTIKPMYAAKKSK